MGALLGVDDLVERVVRALKRAGVYGNTDIIFTSDNGWMLGEHRLVDPHELGRHGDRREVLPLRGLLARAADGDRAGLPGRADGQGRGRQRRPGADDRGDHRRARRRCPRTASRWWRRRSVRRGSTVAASCSRRSRTRGRRRRTSRSAPSATLRRLGRRQRAALRPPARPLGAQSRHADPRYARIKAILARGLARLTACRGKGCRVDVGRLPAPGG